MFRASSSLLLLLVVGSLAACDVSVQPNPIVIEKKTTVIEQKPAPIEIHIEDKK